MKKLDINSIATERIDWDETQVVDRIVRQYENYPKAFQKEAIQNAWDARLEKKKGEGWKVEIYLHKESNGKIHLTIEDFGTTGMNNERLYAFLSLWKPHKEHLDAGGQGQGKFVLMRASKEEILIVESIDEKNSYKCKLLQRGRKSREDISLNLQDLIPQIKPLNHQGTRIWVYDVKKEFLEKVKSAELADFILESWWQVLGPRFNAKIVLFAKEIKLPEIPTPKEEVILFENKQLENFGRIKRLVLAFHEKPIPEIFQGIRVQRANMMITRVPFDVYDKEYRNRFSGYIEFDKDLEKLLKDIEKTDHCGFLYESPWREIKELLRKEGQKFVEKIIPSKEEKRNINISFSEIVQKANQIINDYCPELLGGGTLVPPIKPRPRPPLRIKYLSISKKEVKYGETIKPYCSVFNETSKDKKISVLVELKRSGIKVSGEVYKLEIAAGQLKPLKISEIILDKNNFLKGKYIIRATLKENKHDIDTKSTSFYLETKREPVKKGFIKKVEFYPNPEEPIRYKSLEKGVIKINDRHRDFDNIWNSFLKNPNILNKQIGFYVIKICLDEAINELLKIKMDNPDQDIDKVVREISELRDKMYYDVYI